MAEEGPESEPTTGAGVAGRLVLGIAPQPTSRLAVNSTRTWQDRDMSSWDLCCIVPAGREFVQPPSIHGRIEEVSHAFRTVPGTEMWPSFYGCNSFKNTDFSIILSHHCATIFEAMNRRPQESFSAHERCRKARETRGQIPPGATCRTCLCAFAMHVPHCHKMIHQLEILDLLYVPIVLLNKAPGVLTEEVAP